jgi:hypothetical protein
MNQEQEERFLEILESIDESLVRIADAFAEGIKTKSA